MRAHITEGFVSKAKAAPDTRETYFDTKLHGFMVRVSGPNARRPSGSKKTFAVVYRHRGKQCIFTLRPDYSADPEAFGLSVKEARRQAGIALLKVAQGIDPAAEDREKRRPIVARPVDTVERTARDFLRYLEDTPNQKTQRPRSPTYLRNTTQYLEHFAISNWGPRAVSDIARRDVRELVTAVAATGKQVTANRLLSALSAWFAWCVDSEIITASPAAKLKRPGSEARRERTLSEEELRFLWTASGELGYPYGAYLRMLIALGQRRVETSMMRWADIADDAWTIPSSVTKSARGHLVPLNGIALQILEECPKHSRYVFSARHNQPLTGFSTAKSHVDQIVARMLVGAGAAPSTAWRLHDLRRTVGTGLGRLKIPRFTVSRILNHADTSVTSIYDRHEYAEEKRHALETWGRYLTIIIDPQHNIVELVARTAQ